MNLVKTNIPGFMKDKTSGAIINTDTAKLEKIKTNRQQFKQMKSHDVAIAELHKAARELTQRLEILEKRINV